MKQTHTTTQSLEYIALLSGLSMAGTSISDLDIESTRQIHTQNKVKNFGFTPRLVSIVSATKRSA